ncbi:MAG: aminotransferase class I/II-fold pyridoxal phosphate-dependent enzyme [Bacteroidetes bacterium]|nr:aminotransferase class I/II-fold pyridoxal phosphate-dependent enzyme [Bacteroidota bacterium]
MMQRLKDLEKISRQLEPATGQRKATRKKVILYGEDFLKQIETLKAYNYTTDKGIGLLDSPLTGEPIDIDEALDLLKQNVDSRGLNPASGGHLGYIPGGGIYYSALGDYLAAISNRFAGLFFASPGAVRMENMLIGWLSEILGYPGNAAGNLTSGGSIANLIAIVAARDAKRINSKNLDRSVIYLSQQAHHSVHKAIRISGLNECIPRYVELDAGYRIQADELENAIQKDKANGLNPFLIIASAGTTDVGAIDPLDKIGDIAAKHDLWLHVDAAYGGFFILTEEGKKKLAGIEKSDSICIDPHKGLFLPYGLGAVLVKDISQMKKSHYYLANYMQDALSSTDEPSPADLSPELTKHFRGLRLWLPLKLLGTKPFAACLEEKVLLAKYFYKEIQKLGFEVECEPELSIVTYRYIPKTGDPDAFNKRLTEEVQKDGRVFISSTMLNGKFILRLAILSFRTHLKTIKLTLKILKEKVEMLEGELPISDI